MKLVTGAKDSGVVAKAHRRSPTPVRRLDEAASADTISGACRAAGLAFLRGVASGTWGKRELGEWLVGPYREATRFVEGSPPCVEYLHPIDTDCDLFGAKLADILAGARLHTLTLLEEFALPNSDSEFIAETITRGFVVPVEDEVETLLWVPIDHRRARIRDRVRALFVADYLVSPRDYEAEFFVCHRCEALVFDADSKWLGACKEHLLPSHAAPKSTDAEGVVALDLAEASLSRLA